MHVDDAIRGRRSLKEFDPAPVPLETITELLDLAVMAPNHHRTEPWRFVVLGPESVGRLADEGEAPKLRRSAQAIVVAQAVAEDAATAEEDYAAIAAAIQSLMLAARARDIATFWSTPPHVLGGEALRRIAGLAEGERPVGVISIGRAPGDYFPAAPSRSAAAHTRVLP